MSASRADPYARPYSTHPSESGGAGFMPPPPPPSIPQPPPVPQSPYHTGGAGSAAFTSPRHDDHYLDPAYDDPRLGTSPRPQRASRYQLDDEGPIPHEDDTGGIPLLARHSSGPGGPGMPMPGAYDAAGQPIEGNDDDNFIHYGRIPQRVPRRNKTTKKVQCVSFFLPSPPKVTRIHRTDSYSLR